MKETQEPTLEKYSKKKEIGKMEGFKAKQKGSKIL